MRLAVVRYVPLTRIVQATSQCNRSPDEIGGLYTSKLAVFELQVVHRLSIENVESTLQAHRQTLAGSWSTRLRLLACRVSHGPAAHPLP
jgi:hypothetical protein